MFWGLFFVLLGGLLLLDRWDYYRGGFISKLVIAGLIAWGAAILCNRARCAIRMGKGKHDDAGETAATAVMTSDEDATD